MTARLTLQDNISCIKGVGKKKCEVCGKIQTSGNAVSHSNRHSRRKRNPKIQTVIDEENGRVRKA